MPDKNTNISKYFVGIEVDEAVRLYFTFEDAEKGGQPYIDCFDEFGKKTISYKRLENGIYSDYF